MHTHEVNHLLNSYCLSLLLFSNHYFTMFDVFPQGFTVCGDVFSYLHIQLFTHCYCYVHAIIISPAHFSLNICRHVSWKSAQATCRNNNAILPTVMLANDTSNLLNHLQHTLSIFEHQSRINMIPILCSSKVSLPENHQVFH